jgi:hypothetical protein
MATQPDTAAATDTTNTDTSALSTGGSVVNLYPDDAPKPTEEASPAADTEQAGEAGAEGEPEPVDLDPIAAPTSWDKEAKERFASLPRETQEYVAKRETERENFLKEKSRETQNAKRDADSQARSAVAQIYRAQQEQLQHYVQMFEVPQPDLSLLNSNDENNRALYFQQEAQYRYAAAQRSQAQQQAESARQQAEAIEAHERNELAARELAQLQEQVTEWSDPSERANLLARLETIGAELGYSPELMQQAGAQDIIALKRASEWKAKASKYDQLMQKRMVDVRAAKTAPPPSARPGVPAGQQTVAKSAAQMLYPND